MLSRGSDRDVHYSRGLFDGHVVVEDQFESLALPSRKRRERPQERISRLVRKHRLVRMLERLYVALAGRESQGKQLPHGGAAPAIGCRDSNDGEKPRPERGLATKPRPSVQDLHVYRLEDVLCLVRIPVAAGQRPAEAGAVVFLQQVNEVGIRRGFLHRRSLGGPETEII